MTSAARRILPVFSCICAAALLSGCRCLETETADGCRIKRWSDEWYAIEAQKPVGARQREHCGKLWPPFARPTGEPMEFSHKFHFAHYWPYPFHCEDRAFVRELSNRQVHNGWIAHTTLYDYHFDEDTHKLNNSGFLKLRWILQNAPQDRRMVSVQAGRSEAVSQQRVASVEVEANRIAGDANLPAVALRVTEPLGRPAMEVDAIRRSELESMPSPRITYTQLPTGVGDGGG